MQTVRIDGKDYPWPENNQYFRRANDGRLLFVADCVMAWWCDNNGENLNEHQLSIIASVAVMHFENKANFYLGGNGGKDWYTLGIFAEQSAAAWRELCKEV